MSSWNYFMELIFVSLFCILFKTAEGCYYDYYSYSYVCVYHYWYFWFGMFWLCFIIGMLICAGIKYKTRKKNRIRNQQVLVVRPTVAQPPPAYNVPSHQPPPYSAIGQYPPRQNDMTAAPYSNDPAYPGPGMYPPHPQHHGPTPVGQPTNVYPQPNADPAYPPRY